jgi:translocation and assembly module TamA
LKLGSGIFRELTDAYNEDGVNLHADLIRRYAKTSFRTYGLSIDLTRTDQRAPTVQTINLFTITALGALTWDHSDDPLDPHRGWRFDGKAEPTYSFGDVNQPYLRLQAQVSDYLPLTRTASTVIATRFKLGSVIGGTPATPHGGQSLFEASLELRQKISAKWGVVAFVDAGGVGESSAPDFSNVSAGVGLGVRYNLGFGPIRVDIAAPLQRHPGAPAFQLYLSIGQSF